MKANNPISNDELFKQGLENFDAAYAEADWEAMHSLLDANDDVPFVPLPLSEQRNFYPLNLKSIIIMSTIAILASALLFMASDKTSTIANASSNSSSIENTSHPELVSGSASHPELVSGSASHPELVSGSASHPELVSGSDTNAISIESVSHPELVSGSVSHPELVSGSASHPELVSGSASVPDSLESTESVMKKQFVKVVTKRVWVNDEYRYHSYLPSKDVEDFWVGMYYTNQTLNTPYVLEDSGSNRSETHGFNLQFMSGNAIDGEDVGIYFGLDWGMQFYGRSNKSEVLINTVNEDLGLSYLRTHSNDLQLKAHFEYARFRVIPYVNAGIGARILTTRQTINMLVTSNDYESTTDHHQYTNSGWMTSIGVGAKFRLTPRMHADFRYDVLNAPDIKAVSYSNSRFDGVQYQLEKQRIDLSSSQFRVGLVFDLSEKNRERYLYKEGYYKETTQELLLDSNDESKMIVPCDKDNSRVRYYEEDEDYRGGSYEKKQW
ncbi:MAG: hypothetical protein ACI9NN_001364, partial [Bacteroidia bacterium]